MLDNTAKGGAPKQEEIVKKTPPEGAPKQEEIVKKTPLEEAPRKKTSKKDEDVYVPVDHEKGIYHLQLEKILYTSTGKKVSSPFIQKMSVKEYHMFEKGNAGLGYDVKVLWNPEKK